MRKSKATDAVATMLKPPAHQVAGHRAADGILGPLVDGSGRFYKPLQADERGSSEVAFYTSFSSNPRVPTHIRRFFPEFYGTQLLAAGTGAGVLHPHLVLQDLAIGLRRPSVADVKIGACTWPPSSPPDYLSKCLKKDRETTSARLGFRMSGLQVSLGGGAGKVEEAWKPGREVMKQLSTSGDVKLVLQKFVSSNAAAASGDGEAPDCAFASAVYGGSGGILAQLLELKAWFEDQTAYHFYSSSALLMYDRVYREGCTDSDAAAAPQVKLVDFAHVEEGEGVIDHNFLGGLCSLIKFVSEILTGPDMFEMGSRLKELEVQGTCLLNGRRD